MKLPLYVFIVLMLALFGSFRDAASQSVTTTARVGVLTAFSKSYAAPWHEGLRQGLRELGWTEGANLHIEYRYADDDRARLAPLAAELVAMKVDVIVTTVIVDTQAAKAATTTIPIVMGSVGDAVGAGLVQSLAHPGGNVTGLTQIAPELAGKRLELLKATVPKLTRVALLWNPNDPIGKLTLKESLAAARNLGLQLQPLELRRVEDFDAGFAEATRLRAGAVAATPSALFVANAGRLTELALKHRLPSMFHVAEFARAGGLLAYGPDRTALFHQAATYVDKILRGANPATLPVEQPKKFELVVNMKTAKALGLTIPVSFRLRADEIIER